MSDINLPGYYSRFDPAKNYDLHVYRADKGSQAAEQNEVQQNFRHQLKLLGDVILSDGNLIRDCQCIVSSTTGATQMQAGALYIRGQVREIAAAEFTIPVDQVVNIGAYLVEEVVTELEDPKLRDPAKGTRNFDEAGAARLRVTITWGWFGDGAPGEFFPVYTVENGYVLSKEPPPQLDSVTRAIQKYDVDSAGGRTGYVITGFNVSASFDAVNSKLVYLVGEGRARVNGFPVESPRSVRKIEDMDRDLLAVIAEPHTFAPAGDGKMRVNLDRAPLVTLDRVQIIAQKLATLTHGAFDGAKDVLPDNSVLSIIAVNQGGTWNGTAFVGGTTYVQGTDYKLTAGQVDWVLAGAEVAPGSAYSVVYQYQTTTATIEGQDATGFTLSGAVTGSIVTVDYRFALPRIDAIVLDEEGRVLRVKGVASQFNPAAPSIPGTQLKIATLYHTWSADPAVTQDAVVVMPMSEIRAMKSMVLDLYDLVAQEKLRNSIGLAEPAAKRGLFVDSFNNNNLRDAGMAQTASVFDGEMSLSIDAEIKAFGVAITSAQLLDYTLEPLIAQAARTGEMKVNPYQAFDPLPGNMVLEPGVDFWTVDNGVQFNTITQTFYSNGNQPSNTTTTQQVILRVEEIKFLRPTTVKFKISGFGNGEAINSFTFDGITVTPTAA